MFTIPYEQGAQGGADIYAISEVMDLTLQPGKLYTKHKNLSPIFHKVSKLIPLVL